MNLKQVIDRTCIKVVLLNNDAQPPIRITKGSAGYDIQSTQDLILGQAEQFLMPLNFSLEMPVGILGFIRPRSGWAVSKGLITRSSDIIDSDFRHEVKISLYNQGKEAITIKKGDRIGQIVFLKYPECELEVVEKLSATERTGGFGSTGNN